MLDGYVKGKLSLTEAIAKEIEEREKAEIEAAMDGSPQEEESAIEEPIDEEPEPETDRAAEIEEAHVVPMNAHQANYEEIAAVGGQSICDTLIQLTGKTRLAVERYEVPEKVLPKDLLAISGVYKNFAQTAQIFHNLKMEMEGLSSVLEEVEALLSAR
jgi:predicted CopG family antitoxin